MPAQALPRSALGTMDEVLDQKELGVFIACLQMAEMWEETASLEGRHRVKVFWFFFSKKNRLRG
jgi:hypothetical protein